MSEKPGTVLDLLARGRPGDPALVVPDNGTVVSYAELANRVHTVAGTLRRVGVGPGEAVAYTVGNSPDAVIQMLGIHAAGAVAAPLNAAYTEKELDFYAGDVAPSLVVSNVPAAHAVCRALELRLMTPETLLTESAPAAVEPPSPGDRALVLHTSGTTGPAKQVPLTHANLAASALALARGYDLTSDDVTYVAMPLFHVHGLVGSVLAAFASGGTAVVPQRFAPARVLDHLEPYGITWVTGSPTLLAMLLERDERRRSPARSPSLRFLRSCSAGLPPALLARVEARFECPLVEAYGMTEASHQITSNGLLPGANMAGSVGFPVGTDVVVLAPQGDVGEVAISGPNVTAGYLGDPDANATSFVDGRLRTGDLGSIGGDGRLRLHGRIKELIIRGGENVSPAEVESVLAAHPAVREVACFGLDDAKYGQRVAAAVVVAGASTERDLVDHCRLQLADFKVPSSVYIVETIPRTATGKLQRNHLPDLLGLAVAES